MEDNKDLSFAMDSFPSAGSFPTWERQPQRPPLELVALSRISAATSGLWDLDEILKIGLKTIIEIIGEAEGGIMLLEGEVLSYKVWEGVSDNYAQRTKILIGEGIAGRVAQHGRAMLFEDISQEPVASFPDLINMEGLKAFVSVPLRAR